MLTSRKQNIFLRNHPSKAHSIDHFILLHLRKRWYSICRHKFHMGGDNAYFINSCDVPPSQLNFSYPMKKHIILQAIASAIIVVFVSACGKNDSNESVETNYVSDIIGSSEFFESISHIRDIHTKAEEITESIQPLFASAKSYLISNGYDYH